MKVSSVAQMRAMDRAAIEQYQIPELILMENAGLAVCRVMAQNWPIAAMRWLVLCGLGNNGGDGLVVARQLHALGARIRVLVLGDPARYAGAAATNYAAAAALGLAPEQVGTDEQITAAVGDCDGIVDALLGTGITRPVAGLYADAVAAANASRKPVLSVDIPSGIQGDTGQVLGCAVQAGHTVTFGLPKLGNLLYPGYQYGGALWVSHISFPPELYDGDTVRVATNDPLPLPPRAPTAHKGQMGEALFVAGAGNYYGAPVYAALSFLKAGGGYARLATPASLAARIGPRAGEVVYLPQAETGVGSLAAGSRDSILETAARMDFVVMGPGTSLHPETQQLLRDLAAAIETPLLIDGDGITAVCQNLDVVRARRAPTILTPHTGEMARITGLSAAAIEGDRTSVVRRVAEDLGAILVLKGAHTLIGFPDGRIAVNMSGNSGMATAGSGDVLTGTIAAMVGIGLPVEDAVRQGVFVHGLAGDLAADAIGQDGMTAQDVLDALPAAMRLCREGLGSHADRYRLRVVA